MVQEKIPSRHPLIALFDFPEQQSEFILHLKVSVPGIRLWPEIYYHRTYSQKILFYQQQTYFYPIIMRPFL